MRVRERVRESLFLCLTKQGTIHQNGQLVDTQNHNDSFNGLNSRQHVGPCCIAFHIAMPQIRYNIISIVRIFMCLILF